MNISRNLPNGNAQVKQLDAMEATNRRMLVVLLSAGQILCKDVLFTLATGCDKI